MTEYFAECFKIENRLYISVWLTLGKFPDEIADFCMDARTHNYTYADNKFHLMLTGETPDEQTIKYISEYILAIRNNDNRLAINNAETKKIQRTMAKRISTATLNSKRKIQKSKGQQWL